MKVVVDTSRQSGLLYEVSESNGRYYVYPYGGIFITQQDCIGQTNSMKSALAIVKSHAPGEVYRVYVQEEGDDSDEDPEQSGDSGGGNSIHPLSWLVILLFILIAFSNM